MSKKLYNFLELNYSSFKKQHVTCEILIYNIIVCKCYSLNLFLLLSLLNFLSNLYVFFKILPLSCISKDLID